MKSIKQTVSAPVAILIAALVVVIAYQAGASRVVVVQTQPAVVATVDLPRVLEGLAQRSQAEAKLEAMHTKFQQERDRREQRMRGLMSELEEKRTEHREGKVEVTVLQELVDRIDEEELQFQAWRQFTMQHFDVEQAVLFQDIYRKIKKTISEMAAEEGYDLVVFDTSKGELRIDPEARASRTEQVEQQILSRHVLFAGARLNITTDLIERMNNQFRAGHATR